MAGSFLSHTLTRAQSPMILVGDRKLCIKFSRGEAGSKTSHLHARHSPRTANKGQCVWGVKLVSLGGVERWQTDRSAMTFRLPFSAVFAPWRWSRQALNLQYFGRLSGLCFIATSMAILFSTVHINGVQTVDQQIYRHESAQDGFHLPALPRDRRADAPRPDRSRIKI